VPVSFGTSAATERGSALWLWGGVRPVRRKRKDVKYQESKKEG